MKEEYTKISIQVESVDSEDVITTSSGNTCRFFNPSGDDPCYIGH